MATIRNLYAFARFGYTNGLWSVSNTNSRPYRYRGNFCIAHTMAKHSFSTVAYEISLPFNFRLAYAMGNFLSTSVWSNTAPIPLLEASVCRMKGSDKFGSFRIGNVIKECFNAWNAVSCTLVHCNLFGQPFFVRSVSGNTTKEKFGTNLR